MGKPGYEDLERAIIISNKTHVQRMEKIEQNLKHLTDTMIQSNQVIRKLYDDIEKLQGRVNELESFAKQVIEANKTANLLLRKNKDQSDPNLS